MYTFTGSGTKENVIQTGHIVITFNDVNNISIQNRYPETDSEGLANTDTNSQMTFTVTSDITGDTKVNYALGITDIQEGRTLTQDYIKIYIKKVNNVVAGFTENKGELISSFKPLYIENIMDSHVLLTDVISGSEVHTYTLKAWIDEKYKLPSTESNSNGTHTSNTTSETFTFKIKGYGTTEILNLNAHSKLLSTMILGDNNSNVLSATATLTDEYSSVGDASGLYKSVVGETDSGTTYFYRGNVTNNYVSFAGFTWRIVRINEDSSIRLLLSEGINSNVKSQFNPSKNDYTYMYYSNSDVEGGIKRTVDTWYNDNLKTHEDYIADTEFCEQFKVSWHSTLATAGNVTAPIYSSYTPNFKCSTDANGKGVLTSKVGLLSYDEAIHAGFYGQTDSDAYIGNNTVYWLISPAGDESNANVRASAWSVNTVVAVTQSVGRSYDVRLVISLKADTLATGTGTADDPYIVQTK